MKIALFGGSFDPPHLGHDAIVKESLKKLDIEKLIIMPTFLNPFKSSFKADENQRMSWIKKLWGNLPKTEICDFEIKQKKPVPSIDSVNFIIHKYNPNKLYFIIGADHLNSLKKWSNFEELNKKVEFVIVNRNDIKIPNNFDRLNIKIDISSSFIRKTLDTTQICDSIKKEVKEFYAKFH